MYQRDFDFLEINNTYQLSVVLMADSFFYSVFDTDGTMVCHRSFSNIYFSESADIQPIKDDLNLKLSYSKVVVTVLADYNYQLPAADHDLISLFPSLELKSKLIENIPGNQAVNYFGISKHQEDVLNHLFGSDGYQVKSFVAILATYFLGKEGNFMHLHIEEGHIYLYAQNEGRLSYYNTFQTKTANDVLYFLLAAAKEAGIDPFINNVFVSGWIERNSALFKQLSGYVKNLQLIEDHETRLCQQNNGDNKAHFYFAHNATYLCGS